MKFHTLATLGLLTLSAPLFAAAPASGELSEASGPLTYTGGPFVVSNPTGTGGDVVCTPDPAEQLCDTFTLTLNVSQEFRDDEANKKEVVTIAMSFPNATDDYDFYIYDASGALIAEAAGGSGVQEAATLPLSIFKNGTYTIDVVPFTVVPGDGYEMTVAVGRNKSGTITRAKQGSNLAGGLGLIGLLSLFGFAAIKRNRA